MAIRRELIDELLNEYEMPQDILGEGGLLKEVDDAYPSLETRPQLVLRWNVRSAS